MVVEVKELFLLTFFGVSKTSVFSDISGISGELERIQFFSFEGLFKTKEDMGENEVLSLMGIEFNFPST